MKDYFYSLADTLAANLKSEEVYLFNFSGEASDFIRLNHCQIRQAGNVRQNYAGLSLIRGKKIASHALILSGSEPDDTSRLLSLLAELRQRLAVLPDDPFLLYSEKVISSESVAGSNLPDNQAVMDQIASLVKGRDLVGIYASGKISRGFANSLGQRNWFETNNFNFDWSLYFRDDKAVKQGYAGHQWDAARFQSIIQNGLDDLDALSRKPKTIAPGKYRVYIAPAALNEFVAMLNWGGFGLKSHKTKDSPLIKMIEAGQTLDNTVTLLENAKAGMGPAFDRFGFVKPDNVTLVKAGGFHQALVSPRSAKEFGVATNGANDSESTESFEMQAGSIENQQILNVLDTGLYMNNAWYLNFSDRNNCRVTGMTRFACFWVENGEIKAPVNVMRFDESILRMLGANLVGLTREREFIVSASTYYQRSTNSAHLPGVVVDDFTFTL